MRVPFCEKNELVILVPYRDREEHLGQFIPWMEHFLAGCRFCIVVVEQADHKPFNRGKLFNVGYQIIRNGAEWVCFHDVDLLPVDARCDYSRPERTTHLSAYAEQFGYQLPYEEYIGGVLLTPKEAFEAVDGYSNDYWGWGNEDDDLYVRYCKAGLRVDRRPGRYRSLSHTKSVGSKENDVRFARALAAAAQVITDPVMRKRAEQVQRLLPPVEPLDGRPDGLSTVDYAHAKIGPLRGTRPSLKAVSPQHRLIRVPL